MNNKVTGLIHITGEPDTGKSTLAMTTGHQPDRICFFDDDIKTKSIADMLEESGTPFGAYYNLIKLTAGMTQSEFHKFVIRTIDSINPGQFDVIVFDTWTRFENTFFYEVERNPNRFREKYSSMGKIKGAEMWNASFDYENQILDILLEKAPLVILVTHVTAKYVGQVNTGALKAACKRPVERKSRLRIWTRHNPDSSAPIGLILKRLEKVKVTPYGIVPINILPRKVAPCTWQRIMEYWENPIDDKMPEANEVPDSFELSILDGILTEDQKKVFAIGKIQLEREERELKEIDKLANTIMKPKYPINLVQLIGEAHSKLDLSMNQVLEKLGMNIAEINSAYESGDGESIWSKLA